ncbi:MAG: CbiX/SirB N-terminal domain-containing protein, partial [Candidatus Contubernalis sp.]|nr:CbiX/SirB N-terminal domain-containing protein [Candidatus Contubernalis sp.]
MNSGIILLAHGSRKNGANEVMEHLLEMVREDFGINKVTCAFLQFSNPTLQEALKEQVEAGVQEVTVVPVFLFNGIHINEDIPKI